MSRQTRRTFLKQAAAGAVVLPFIPHTFAIAGTKGSGRILGANETIHVAVAGIHGRGGDHINQFGRMKNVQITYLVDPDRRWFADHAKGVARLAGNTPKCVQDIREVLEDKDLDVVSVATCNHWHSLITIWACQYGKDVYVEKPSSHNVFEGRKCVEAARKYGRIVQHGTQSRSDPKWQQMVAAVHSGKFGKLLVAKGYASKDGQGRWSIGFKPNREPPKDLDFNLWLGPAPMQPYHENLVPYNWHWFWDTGNGEIGNQGVHQMDIARWAIGDRLPRSVIAMGGRYVNELDYKDQAQTPNMQLAVMDFGGPLLVFEVRGLIGNKAKKREFPPQVTNEFYLEEGLIKDGKFFPKGKKKGVPLAEVKTRSKHGGGDVDAHFQNFIDCVRSRKQEDLNADILQGHLTAACCHLANISYRLGEQVPFGQKYEALGECPQVKESIKAIEANLDGALEMDLAKATYTLGPKLDFDPQAERFVDNDQANALLTRAYRDPFIVPEKV